MGKLTDILVGIFLGATLIVWSHPTLSAQWSPTPFFTIFAPPNDVSFTISTSDTAASSQDIAVKYQITNVSGKALYAPRLRRHTCPPMLNVSLSFESSDGRHGGGTNQGGSCGVFDQTIAQRMDKEAVLLKPGDHTEDTVMASERLPPGEYRVEAVLSGWNPEKFSASEQQELAAMGHPFLRGEIPASTRITLTATK
jgi:hypothetical protein